LTRAGSLSLLALFFINLMNFYDRSVIAAVAEPIRKEWGLSDTALGGLGTLFIVLYAIVGLPLGRMADRWSRTRLLAACTALWSAMTAASGMAGSYLALAAARLGVGVGEAGCAPAANSLLGDLFPSRVRARAISLFMLGLPFGTLLNFALSGAIAQAWGWRAAFLVPALPGLLLAGLVLFIAEPPRGTADGAAAGSDHGRAAFRRVLELPTMWWLILSGALHNFNMYAINSFSPAYLMRFHGTDLRTAGFYTAFAAGAAGIPGLLAGGWLADRAGARRPGGRLLVGALAVSLSTPLFVLALATPAGNPARFAVLLGGAMTLVFFYYSTVYATIQDVIEPDIRGTAMAIYFFAMYLLGGGIGPLVIGGLSDRFANRAAAAAGVEAASRSALEPFRAAGLHGALWLIPIVFALLAVVMWAASRTTERDVARVRERSRQASGLRAA
jgi:MFS family permease